MGEIISKITDPDGTNEKALNENQEMINTLVTHGELQAELFYTKILSQEAESKYLPIDKVLTRMKLIRINVDPNNPKIGDEIKDIIGNLVKGSFKEAIQTTLASALTAFLGSESIEENARESYCVTVGNLGGIRRMDYLFYSYAFQSEDFSKTMKNIVVISLVISSVKTSLLDDNGIAVIVDESFPKVPVDKRKRLIADIIKEKEDLDGKK